MSRIIVKNLPDQITKEKLKQIFSEKGVVTDIQLKFTKDGKFRKFAFVGFQNSEMAEAARESLNKSFINTSQIQIEICAELGDPNKPKPWSKYAPENLRRVQGDKNNEKDLKSKPRKSEKQKIKDCKVLELLKNHKNDKLFTEFLEVNVPDLLNLDGLGSNEKKTVKKSNKKKKRETVKEDDDYEDDDEDDDDDEYDDEDAEEELKKDKVLANKDISDSEYIKLKTGVNLNLKDDSTGSETTSKKFTELYTVKLSGLRLKIKKSEIKEFLSPIQPYTIRRARGIKGIAYCGFLTEKEMKLAILKNRSFLHGRRIFVTVVKKHNSLIDKNTEIKWTEETERLKGLESVGESGRIFIRNLSYTATEDDLKEKFEKYGPITEFILPIDSFTRKPKGFAIVTFLIPEHACKAFNELDGTIYQGRMLHLLPALPNKTNEEDINCDDTFKVKKLKKEKAKSGSSVNWNTFFIGENSLANAMAATYNTTKENVLNDKGGGAAVRLALGETQLVNEIKEFLEENDVCLEVFENLSICPRSNTVILVKNLPFGTKPEEIREKFCQFGELKRVVVPPTGVAALIEFIEPFEAKKAFRRISYSKFKHLPMYLEWAPKKVFKLKEESDDGKDVIMKTEPVKDETPSAKVEPSVENSKTVNEHIPVEGATIFVKNLNFATGDEALWRHFSTCGRIVNASVALKKSPTAPGKKLSMGYGFVEFSDKEAADKALKILQFTTLDDHKIELKRSNRTVAPAVWSGRKTSTGNEKPSSKIMVRNVPFQATQKEIFDLFKVFGEIKSVRLPKKMVGTGTHRGFCFIEFNTTQDAKRAFTVLSQSTHLYGRRLVLEWAAADDDVATLREKTAQQFKSGTIEKKKNVTIEEDSEEE